MASAGIGGMPGPDTENGNELHHEQDNEEDRRRQQACLPHEELTANRASAGEQQQLQPTRPERRARAADHGARQDQAVASPAGKPEAPPRSWQDRLIDRLTKLNDEQRAEYERQLNGARDRNGVVTPQYQLDLAALVAKNLPRPHFGRDLHELNRRENEARRVALLAEKRSADQQRPAGQIRASSTRDATAARASARDHESGRRPHPAPRQAAPDRTGLVRKRLQRLGKHHAEQRQKLNLPQSPAEQDKIARLNADQNAERKALLDRQSMEIRLLDYQHATERTSVAAQFLAGDLRQLGSPDAAAEAASCAKEARQALRAMQSAYERREALVANRTQAPGRDNPASSPAHGGATPRSPDQDVFFKDGNVLLTEDRLRRMLGRYEEIREIRAMPPGLQERKEQSHLADSQATVRKRVLDRHNKQAHLLDQRHLAERVGASAEGLARDTGQPRYRAEAQRAFAVARLTLERSEAVDPRSPRALDARVRAAGAEQINRQTAAQDAAKGSRTLTSGERASLPPVASASRDRSARSSERPGAGQDRRHGTGRGGNSRGGGGRGR